MPFPTKTEARAFSGSGPAPSRSRRAQSDWPGRLPRVLHAPHLAHHRHFDLAGVLHLVLDLLGDVAGDLGAGAVVDELGVYDDADLAADPTLVVKKDPAGMNRETYLTFDL